MFAFVWLEKQKPTSSHWQNPRKKKNDISCNSCRLWHWEERREQPGEGGEQLTRSDTGKRGDLIAQLAKSTGRKRQERLVSVWPRSLLLLVGPSLAFLSPLIPPTQSYSHPHPHPVLLPHTAACHGSLHRNRMISSHLLLNMGHHGSHAKAGPFVSDRGHWYLGGRRRSCHGQLEGSIIFWMLIHVFFYLYLSTKIIEGRWLSSWFTGRKLRIGNALYR